MKDVLVAKRNGKVLGRTSSSGPGRAARGGTCRRASGTGKRSITGIAGGRWTGPGRARQCGWSSFLLRLWQGCGWLDRDGRAVCSYLGHDVANFVAVEAHCDDGVGSFCARLLPRAPGTLRSPDLPVTARRLLSILCLPSHRLDIQSTLRTVHTLAHRCWLYAHWRLWLSRGPWRHGGCTAVSRSF